MHVISDADIIIHLSKLESLFLLKVMYTEVAIPEYVKSEILEKDDKGIHAALGSFLKVFSTPINKAENIANKHGIHIGEAHVKALGEELKSSLFLSNERKVRKAAKEEGFNITGTLGIILKAVKKRALKKSEALSILEKMKSQVFRIHPEILQKAVKALKEMSS